MRSRIAVEGDRMWRLPLMPDCLHEEGLGCGYIACPAEPEVDCLSALVYGAIEVGPLPAHLEWSKRQSVVELFPCLFSPNRTCTSQRIRLSVQEEHTSELQSLRHLVCRLLLE